jgi:hypothetical protein
MNRTIRIAAIAGLLLCPTWIGIAAKTKKAADYFPLRVGYSWKYQNLGGEGGYTLKILREEPQPDGPAHYVVEMSSGVIVLNTFSKASGWVLMHSEQYPEHEGLEAKYDPPRQYLPDPLTVGAKWEWKGKDYTQVNRQEKNVVAGFETVTVPAGKFRALKVVSQITTDTATMTKTYWYAENVGLVKSTTSGGQIKYGSELTEYSFKQAAK